MSEEQPFLRGPILPYYFHTRRRLEERYGIPDCSSKEYLGMIGQVRDPNADTLVVHRDDGTELHQVNIRGEKVIVLMGKTPPVIHTAYPPDATILRPWMVD